MSNHIKQRLEHHYAIVTEIILNRQNPVTGLIPASVAVTNHGDYRDAWTRDNVYSIIAVWALALAYRRMDVLSNRTYELEHAVVKCMRGLLFCLMRQAHKVEKFKNSQHPLDSLHAKYNTSTGDTVVADDAWGHLQIDATSIFLLFLAQMTASGLQIIYTLDEVAFCQNLIYYIERAYRISDFGIWERGSKSNHGQSELNSSSIGMAVSALQAMNGLNLYGSKGGPESVVHALPDEISRNVTILNSALPRESNSKEIDAALLSVIGFPAFAVTDPTLIDRTRDQICAKLEGKYGCKRFLRDGHQCVLEDPHRLHYEPNELLIFEHIESEWPLFFTYMILDGFFNENPDRVTEYTNKLNPLLVVKDNVSLVPELYYVPRDKVDKERQSPKSQVRVPNANVPLVWAQSLKILGELLQEKLITVAEVDPLGRRLRSRHPVSETVVQVVLVAEDNIIQEKLFHYGLFTQTEAQLGPIKIMNPLALRDCYTHLGANAKLGLTGRPTRPLGILSTSKIYRVAGELYAFTPSFLDAYEFYVIHDTSYMTSFLQHELIFLKSNWQDFGRPTVIIPMTHHMLGTNAMANDKHGRLSSAHSRRVVLNFLMALKTGRLGTMTLRLGRLSEYVHTSSIVSLDFINHDLWTSIVAPYAHAGPTCEIGKLKVDTSMPKVRSSRAGSSIYSNTASEMASPSVDFSGHYGYPPMSPLSFSTSPALLTLKFKDPSPQHAESTSSSLTSLSGELGHLRLGDSAQSEEAEKMLEQSSDIYQQAQILYYFVSCFGVNHSTSKLGPIRNLLEEVYQKALGRNWCIVRLAAGLLRKTITSLTINIIDLLVRNKMVTIGLNSHYNGQVREETTITAPMNPSCIADLIFRQCFDPHESVLVQEIITTLGMVARSQPELFRGMIRVRIHHLIRAMRDEVARSHDCKNERDAMDALYHMTPHDISNLLVSLLKGERVKSLSRPGPTQPVHSIIQHLHEPALCVPQERTIVVTAQSAGYSDGNFAKISVNGVELDRPMTRGIHVGVIDRHSGEVIEIATFDTHYSVDASEDFADLLMNIEDDAIVVLAIQDDGIENLTVRAKDQIELLGFTKMNTIAYRDSLALIGSRAEGDEIIESHSKSQKGHSGTIRRTLVISLTAREGDSEWLHKRKVEGALNKVPQTFFPRVYRVLERCQAIKVGTHVLPREPTVSDKTPGEYNFCCDVDTVLDGLEDPAERAIAVDTLMLIHHAFELDGFPMLGDVVIDLTRILEEAILTHARKVVDAYKDSDPTAKKTERAALTVPREKSPNRNTAEILERTRHLFQGLDRTQVTQYLKVAISLHLPQLEAAIKMIH